MRTIELEDDYVKVRLTGLTHFEALTARLAIPYAAIRDVSTEPFRPPPGMLRWGGTSVPFTDIRKGHFRSGGDWYFLSYERRSEAVTLRLEGFALGGRAYKTVVLGTEEPQELASAIRARSSKS